jgi:hypothetical protein
MNTTYLLIGLGYLIGMAVMGGVASIIYRGTHWFDRKVLILFWWLAIPYLISRRLSARYLSALVLALLMGGCGMTEGTEHVGTGWAQAAIYRLNIDGKPLLCVAPSYTTPMSCNWDAYNTTGSK